MGISMSILCRMESNCRLSYEFIFIDKIVRKHTSMYVCCACVCNFPGGKMPPLFFRLSLIYRYKCSDFLPTREKERRKMTVNEITCNPIALSLIHKHEQHAHCFLVVYKNKIVWVSLCDWNWPCRVHGTTGRRTHCFHFMCLQKWEIHLHLHLCTSIRRVTSQW